MAEAARIQTPYLVAEDDLDRSLRPRRLADFVGQEPLREQLAVAIEAAVARGEALDHVLLAGPPGLGKTSLAHIVAAELEVPLVHTAGPALERKGDVAAFLTALLPALTADAETRAQRAQEANGVRASQDVQRELVAIGDHLALAGSGAGASPSGAPQPPDDALVAWAQLIGLGAPGQRFASAVVERFGGNEVQFRLRPDPDPPLRVMVERDTGQPSFLRAGPYAISYVGRHGEPLPPAEEKFIRP